MNRVRPPLLVAALTFGLACAHAPEAPEERPASRSAPASGAHEPAPSVGAKAGPRTAERATPAPRSDKGDKGERPGAQASATPPGSKPPPAKTSSAPAAGGASGAVRSELGPGDYFPLAVGNEWMYVDQSPALPQNRRGVLRTVRIVERTADGFYRDNERGNLRVDGNCIRDRDRRLLCLPFTVGASWTSVLSSTTIERYEIASAGDTIETPAGKFERCVRVRAHNRVKASIDQVLEITYAPRVGPVLIETYVVVDGRVTPQVKALLQSYKVNGGT